MRVNGKFWHSPRPPFRSALNSVPSNSSKSSTNPASKPKSKSYLNRMRLTALHKTAKEHQESMRQEKADERAGWIEKLKERRAKKEETERQEKLKEKMGRKRAERKKKREIKGRK